MRIEKLTEWLFRVNAVINWTLAIRGIWSPLDMATMFGGPPPNYSFLVRLWSGLVFMFGAMFWEVANDVRGKAALLKYNWIEKSITALAVTLGYLAGDVPRPLMFLIFLTNWLWIPAIFYCDIAMRRKLRARGSAPAVSG